MERESAMSSRSLTAGSLRAFFRAGGSGWPELGDECCVWGAVRGCCLRTGPSALAALIAMLKKIQLR